MGPLIKYRISLAAAFLTVLIAFQSVGWLMALQGLQLGARIESQRALFQPVNILREATFHQALFQKLRIGRKEIRLNGQLFDYRILSENGDSVHLALYHDKAEESLLTVLDQKINPAAGPKDTSGPPMSTWLAQWLGSAFLLPGKPALSPGIEPLFQKHTFASLSFLAQSAPSVFAPPPEAGV